MSVSSTSQYKSLSLRQQKLATEMLTNVPQVSCDLLLTCLFLALSTLPVARRAFHLSRHHFQFLLWPHRPSSSSLFFPPSRLTFLSPPRWQWLIARRVGRSILPHPTPEHALSFSLLSPLFFLPTHRSSPSASLSAKVSGAHRGFIGNWVLPERPVNKQTVRKGNIFFNLWTRSHTQMRLFLVWYWWKTSVQTEVETEFAVSATKGFMRKMLFKLILLCLSNKLC